MHYCDSHNCMPTARLIGVCQKEEISNFDKRQIPIHIDENLIMKLQFDDSCITYNHHIINKKSKAYHTFLKTYQKLTIEEFQDALCVSINQIKEYILRCVPCIGCRTSIDNFIKTILEYRLQTLEPIIINENDLFTIKKCYSSCPDYIYRLFYIDGSKLNSFIESIPKSKKHRRCYIHLLDKTKSINDWQIVWDLMTKECQDEITLVETDSLLDSLENYLHKHRFCSECKLKVLEAYDLLLDNHDNKYQDRKDFSSTLYNGLKSCTNDKHIHIQSNKEFLGNLISRAELEIEDCHRERHAKTLDIAQEEILICIGIYLYERFDKIYRIIKSEEQTWQLLFYIMIDCLRLNFEKAIDRKQDFSMQLNILCEEFRINDKNKKQKKIKKKIQRQKTKHNEKSLNDNKQEEEELRIRCRANSSCSHVCHSYNQQSNSLSLIKSQSWPLSLLFPSEQNINLSSSLETLFSSESTRYYIYHETNSSKQPISCEECQICIRCSSTRTDLGYSSELDDISSSGPCECLTDYKNNCSSHELSNDICKNNYRINDTVINCIKTIELCDITRKHKLKVELSDKYPFFNMDLKQTWDETIQSISEYTSFISDDDLEKFLLINTDIELKRAQLRENFKLKFQTWQQQTLLKT